MDRRSSVLDRSAVDPMIGTGTAADGNGNGHGSANGYERAVKEALAREDRRARLRSTGRA
jgi:hypothetical protein